MKKRSTRYMIFANRVELASGRRHHPFWTYTMGKGSSDTKLRKRSRRADDSTTPVTPSPVSIPPLLSPTLPPALAGDFARSGRDKPACLEKKETFIVTLKYNKWNAGAVQRILRKPLHGVPECPLFRDDSLPLRGYSENLFWASYFLSQPGPFSLSQIAVKTKKVTSALPKLTHQSTTSLPHSY